ncbi:MAG: glycosyltransferase family 8 protein [Candidatus Gastranaerophilaceae bacterium]
MNCKKYINLLFSGTSNYFKYASVVILSALENLEENVGINVYFLYADIIKPIDEETRNVWFEQIAYSFKGKNVDFEFINVIDKMHLVENLNIGQWGREMSLTHYIHYLAPLVIENVDKIIHIDCDFVVNCNLSEVYDIDLGENLIALVHQSGFEIDKEDYNGGFSIINLKQWKIENTLDDIIKFGEQLPKSDFCDQYLINSYFRKTHPDRLLVLDKKYNLFPMTCPELKLEEIKNLHFAGPNVKPWYDFGCEFRGSFLWWMYAKKTTFYESFIFDHIQAQKNILMNDYNTKFDYIREYVDYKVHKNSIKYLFVTRPVHTLLAIQLALFDELN